MRDTVKQEWTAAGKDTSSGDRRSGRGRENHTLPGAGLLHINHVRLENFPDVRKVADAPFFISNGLQLIPSLLRLISTQQQTTYPAGICLDDDSKGLVFSLTQRNRSDDNKVIILDQGPVYLLAEMRLFGPEYLRQKDAERFWQDLYRSLESHSVYGCLAGCGR